MRVKLLAITLEHALVLLAVLCIGVAVEAASVTDALACCVGAIVAALCAIHLHDDRFHPAEDIQAGEPRSRFTER